MTFSRCFTQLPLWMLTVLIVLAAPMLGCEEEYLECHDDRAPADFPPNTDRIAQCEYVCSHMESIGCRLGCPYIPDAGPDANPGSVETTVLNCRRACRVATMDQPEVPEVAINRVLHCYAGTETCRQLGACSQFCSVEGGVVWPDEFLCRPVTQ